MVAVSCRDQRAAANGGGGDGVDGVRVVVRELGLILDALNELIVRIIYRGKRGKGCEGYRA